MLKSKKNENEVKESIFDTLPADYLLLSKTVQDLIPFDTIENFMICLPSYEYRMIVEVSSLNYYLKTASEQEAIENMFRAALTSWDFPFAFYTQTRNLEADEIERILKEDVRKCSTPQMVDYGNQFIRNMGEMNRGKNGILVKKNYIIVECNDAASIRNNTSDDDKKNYAFDKLSLNCRKVAEGLSPLGLKCKVLDNSELAELLFVAINKQSAFSANDLLGHISNTVLPYDEWSQVTVKMMFEGFKTQLNDLLDRSHNIDSDELQKAKDLLKKINDIEAEVVDTKKVFFDL